MGNEIFNNLFILELANNHWGDIDRGKAIVKEFAKVVHENNVKVAIKLQFRDTESFIHKEFKKSGDGQCLFNLSKRFRYIQKTKRSSLNYEEFYELVEFIKNHDCIPMATPFDEESVRQCIKMNLPIIKVASSDINDWLLLKHIASIKKPVIISSGGANEKQIDDAIIFFKTRNISIALNHCISKYPTEDDELELNQIDYFKSRYPDLVVGLSTHEYKDWHSSMIISYAKGARLWERHIDLPYPKGHEQTEISKYCSLPHQVDEWFKAFKKAQSMCGTLQNQRRVIDDKELNYVQSLFRGLYLKHNLKKGQFITLNDLYSVIPFQKEIDQLTIRNFNSNEYVINKNMPQDAPLTKNDISGF